MSGKYDHIENDVLRADDNKYLTEKTGQLYMTRCLVAIANELATTNDSLQRLTELFEGSIGKRGFITVEKFGV